MASTVVPKNAASLREDWLCEQAKALAADGSAKEASVLKCLQHHEKTRQLF